MNTDPATAAGAPAFGFNVYGYLTADLGLGVAARNTVRMLIDNGYSVRLSDVSPGRGMSGRDTTFAEEIAASAGREAYAINLFHINPDQMLYLLNPLAKTVTLRDRVNACVPFWELPRLPRSWIEPLAAMDVILAPTLYVRDTVLADLPDARVIHYPQAVHLPDGIAANRVAFGLPGDAVVFVMSFDMRSDIERKNPWGVVEAFLRAFPERQDVRLVINVNNVETLPGLARHVERVRKAAADPRVVVLDTPMSYADVLALYASSDVLVSLHRAEGLGLSLLEAMSLGKPVVATAFSGTMDFTTSENSCLVGYDLVSVSASTQPAYGKTTSGAQMWAEPRVDEAARAMRALAEAPDLRERIGARAKADAERIRADYDRGEVVGRLAGLVADPQAGARMRALSRRFFGIYARRVARGGLLRARLTLAGGRR